MSFIERLLKTNSHVHVHNDKRARVEQTIHALISDGQEMLHIVVNFDFRLTMYEKDGLNLPSTFAFIEDDERVKVRISVLFTIQIIHIRVKICVTRLRDMHDIQNIYIYIYIHLSKPFLLI